MDERIENIEKVIDYWKESSDQNFATMINLMKSRDYVGLFSLGTWLLKSC